MGRVFREIVVIADDLTGAADTGAQFCPLVGPIPMSGAEALPRFTEKRPSPGLAVYTNTRSAPAQQAGRVVGEVAEYIRAGGYRTLYKKIDSCLRGNIGSEIDMLISKLGCPASFVAPALPSQGRITVHDIHTVNGRPVAESEAGRDLLSPVRSSRLSELVAGQSRFGVGHVDGDCLAQGAGALYRRVNSLIAGGRRHIAFDASGDEHLDAIVSLARESFRDVLLVGSAGLASALARAMMAEQRAIETPTRPGFEKPLFVCGSASAMLAAQREELAHIPGMKTAMLDPEELVLPQRDETIKARLEQLASPWREGGMVLAIRPFSPDNPGFSPARVLQGFAAAAAELIKRSAPDIVFLSGGDTAEAVCGRLGADVISLLEELMPGLVRGELGGGEYQGLAVVTKAGSFGSPQTLVDLIKIIYKY